MSDGWWASWSQHGLGLWARSLASDSAWPCPAHAAPCCGRGRGGRECERQDTKGSEEQDKRAKQEKLRSKTQKTGPKASRSWASWLGRWWPCDWDLYLLWRGLLGLYTQTSVWCWRAPWPTLATTSVPKSKPYDMSGPSDQYRQCQQCQQRCTFCGAACPVDAIAILVGFVGLMPPATEATSATFEISDIAKGAYVASSSHSSREVWKPNATSRWTSRANHIWWGTRRSGAAGAILPGLCGKAPEQLCRAGGEVLRLCGTLPGRRVALWLCTCSGWKAASVEVAAFTMPSWRKPSNGTRRMGGPISRCHQWWTAKAHGDPEHPPFWPS